ncbi:hypothetical protein MtrunA17_Chr8g0355481 [Medicago truncatula]|uniref:Uncharacterized protein n=1 Tax=Medicago truncatula TaxID=3880 RepID=A0A396GH10_MEDTR|nr:hypothetical protein MtrunA17_Chr8g0355481 [Medicago truncatula]
MFHIHMKLATLKNLICVFIIPEKYKNTFLNIHILENTGDLKL